MARKKARKPRKWDLVTFAELDAWRKSQGLSQKGCAERLSVTNSTWHNWKRGVSVATPNTQARIRAIIGGKAPVAERGASQRVEASAEVVAATGQIVAAWASGAVFDVRELGEATRVVRDVLSGGVA